MQRDSAMQPRSRCPRPCQSRVSNAWKEAMATLPYTTGVSLHSHTSASEESLTFIHKMGTENLLGRKLSAYYEGRARRQGLTLDFLLAHWRPPLQPRMAYRLEEKQITGLGLQALVSLTDHDNIQAPLLLRTLPLARHIPISLEWSAPFGATEFHIGVHNLPSAAGAAWVERLQAFTARPSDAGLQEILLELDAIPQVLVVLNHPLWDLHKIGRKQHHAELDRFLCANNLQIHALELNGLRHAQENREVVDLAPRWNQLLISGGDRHGLEPNANINLTTATSFTDFVHEIRVERRSHVLFMPQYAQPWERRLLHSTLDAITDHPHFSPGWQRWDERAFHPDREGVQRPFRELWVDGRPPRLLSFAIAAVRLLRHRTLARTLSLAFPGVNTPSLDQEVLHEVA